MKIRFQKVAFKWVNLYRYGVADRERHRAAAALGRPADDLPHPGRVATFHHVILYSYQSAVADAKQKEAHTIITTEKSEAVC
jgi:hypothetical protein